MSGVAVFGCVGSVVCTDTLFVGGRAGYREIIPSVVGKTTLITSPNNEFDYSRFCDDPEGIVTFSSDQVKTLDAKETIEINGSFTDLLSDLHVAISGNVVSLSCKDLVCLGEYFHGRSSNIVSVRQDSVIDTVGVLTYDCGFKFYVENGEKPFPHAELPMYSTSKSAGVDFFCAEDVEIPPGKCMLVHTGISSSMIDTSNVLQLYARSSMAKRGLILANSVGIIDCDYEGEIIFNYYNYTDKPVLLERGERIGQGIFYRYIRAENIQSVDSVRSTGGFGSTGV